MPLHVLILVSGALVFAGFPASLVFQLAGQSRALSWGEIAVCLAFGFCALALVVWAPIRSRISRVAVAAEAVSLPPLWMALLAGTAVRLVAVWWIDPQPASDGASYLALAQGLILNGQYGDQLTRGYWPPGMAFALVPFLSVASQDASLAAFGVTCFLVTAVGAYRLARLLDLGPWALWGPWLLALWPTHILMTGLPEKELIVIAAVPWLVLFAVRSLERAAWAVAAGLILGGMVLVQPSFQLLPLFAAALAGVLTVEWRRIVPSLVLSLLFAAVVVAPWTVRNHQVFGQFVLVSTNGGSNLYRVNNDLATGGYIAKGTVDVDALGELASDREGKRLAKEWISSNPARFVQLTAARALMFAGDHSYGAYAAFRAEPDRIPRTLYLGLKAGTALTWLVLWAVIAAASATLSRQRLAAPQGAGWLLLPWAYLFAIHSIFESGSKYHLPAIMCVLLLAVAMGRAVALSAKGRA